MRRKLMSRVMIYALGLALLLTLGMRFQQLNNDQKPVSPAPILLSQPSVKPVDTIIDTTSATVPLSTITDSASIRSKNEPIQDIAKSPDSEVRISALVSSSIRTYEVTAYYLNVRANAYPKSKIIDIVKKGTKLAVSRTTDNGWLRINGGGYVHGDYAKLVDEGIIKSGEETREADGLKEPNELKESDEASDDIQAIEEDSEVVKPSSTVGTESGLTEEDISVIFNGTALEGHGLEQTILEVEEEYGINALFTIAVMKLESGNGSSRLAKNKNNLFGLNASGKDAHKRAFSFETKGDSVRKFGQLLSKNYVGKGYTTIEKIATKYCPANSKWSGLVKNIMTKDYKKLNVI
ncbi:glucosaminidase domain-containing protein [Cohnella herbarum]|uniref:SH3 domain-containing protein n=1 Tax=Cohnella herbarum TaxID=2728023 RepID=A0A7Z2VH73_9BACL|nr:glucosaminidase domain-containing protein [Cohnella herbarum]QJD83141.1 SH3 domain-containing protein [Cohnella herbarum]